MKDEVVFKIPMPFARASYVKFRTGSKQNLTYDKLLNMIKTDNIIRIYETSHAYTSCEIEINRKEFVETYDYSEFSTLLLKYEHFRKTHFLTVECVELRKTIEEQAKTIENVHNSVLHMEHFFKYNPDFGEMYLLSKSHFEELQNKENIEQIL